MRENRLKALWAEGGSAVNGWLSIPSAFAAETMAHQGWDSLTIDLQHGVIDYQTAVTMLQAISTTDTTPLVRVPWLDPGIVMKMLDAGAYGVICPMVNTAADAERLVAACRYPPRGNRSFGPARAVLYAGADYAEHADETVLAFAMIETKEGLANLDAILATPGLDGVYIGPADLCYSMTGRFGFDHTEPPLLDAIMTMRERAAARGVLPAIHCGTAAYARRMIQAGFRLVTAASDAALMTAGGTAALAEARGGGDAPPQGAAGPAGPY